MLTLIFRVFAVVSGPKFKLSKTQINGCLLELFNVAENDGSIFKT
jgi:hypothetical protein